MALVALVLGVVFGILLAILNGVLMLYGLIKELFYRPLKATFR
jgi:hypothetical protein